MRALEFVNTKLMLHPGSLSTAAGLLRLLVKPESQNLQDIIREGRLEDHERLRLRTIGIP